ncbi:MAG: hypothetical protein GX082_04515 [Clostridiaceae bacterium]|nr:hypothetical protein [Clostridiaceae bacterium]
MTLSNMSVKQIGDKLKKKEISAVELTKVYLGRIKKEDPKKECFVTLWEAKALRQAGTFQKKQDKNGLLSFLAGIPCGLQDHICTENLSTEAGSVILKNFIPPYNATVVEKILDRLGIPLGKLRMSEFGMNPDPIQCGAAQSVSKGWTVYSLGSDVFGSVSIASVFWNIAGLRPTHGLVSRYGLIASSSLDQIGIFANRVEDCAAVLSEIAGQDPRDPLSASFTVPDYTTYLRKGVRGLKIGFLAGAEDDAKVFEKQGAEVKEVTLSLLSYIRPIYDILFSAEASSALGRYDGIKYGYRSSHGNNLSELYTRSRGEAFGSEAKKYVLAGTHILSSEQREIYNKALKGRYLIAKESEDLFTHFDVLLMKGNPKEDDLCLLPALTGMPALTVPKGSRSENGFYGIRLMANRFQEGLLFQAGHLYRSETGGAT